MLNKRNFVRQALYGLKHTYGMPVDAYKFAQSVLDPQTGNRVRTESKITIERVVALKESSMTTFLYDLGKIITARDFSQGNWYGKGTQLFLVAADEIPVDYRFEKEDYLVISGRKLTIVEATFYDESEAWVLKAHEADGELVVEALDDTFTDTIGVNDANID